MIPHPPSAPQSAPHNSPGRRLGPFLLGSLLLLRALAVATHAASPTLEFTPSADSIACYDFLEVTVEVSPPPPVNPFTDVTLQATLRRPDQTQLQVDGFCDSPDGRVFRIRFMPQAPGPHQYTISYRQGDFLHSHEGAFQAVDQRRKGIVRVDPEFPSHFQWDGTRERFFWNGTTAYWLAGWDTHTITQIIERYDRLRVTRVRAALNGRVKDGQAWFEPVYPTDRFSFLLNPWIAQNPDSVENPAFDVTRFNIPHWQKFEHLLREARRKDVVVSVIFYVDGARPGVDPFGKAHMGGEAEQRYYRYAIARFAPFSNVMWDLANEYRHFRDDPWAEKMGTFVKQTDPYQHLTSVHGHGDFRFGASAWADFAMFQSWDEHGGASFMLQKRAEQLKTGRLIPLVNEEYGYEDHYPKGWGDNRVAPARSAETRRRLAWEIYLAGGYQTTGERAHTGGGWINGYGDDSMTLLNAYAPIHEFFTSIAFWKLQPAPDLVVSTQPASPNSKPAPALAARSTPGDLAVIYLPNGGIVSLKPDLLADGLRPLWISPRDAGVRVARAVKFRTYKAPSADDWILLLSTPCNCSFRDHDNEFEGQSLPRRGYQSP
jgi:hypothetical protein